MAEGVQVPADGWRHSKLLREEFMTHYHVVEYVIIVRSGLIIGHPSSIYDLQLFALQQVLHALLGFVILFVVPHAKEAHFSYAKPPLWVLGQLSDHRVQDVLDACMLSSRVRPRIILIYRLHPAHVIVGMWHEVHHHRDVLVGPGVRLQT